jgi:hypothetical protein
MVRTAALLRVSPSHGTYVFADFDADGTVAQRCELILSKGLGSLSRVAVELYPASAKKVGNRHRGRYR